MLRKDELAPTASEGIESETVLRAKYLDYCSAQVADVLLLLSPDEMYVLAEDAAREAGLPDEPGYERIVSLATERISSKLALPPFQVWVGDYLSNPDRYEQYFMGLWESELQGRSDG